MPLVLLVCVTACSGASRPGPTPAPAAIVNARPPAGADGGITRPAWASEYPATRKVEVVDRLFGMDVADPYRWLEDGKSPEVRDWMNAEDALTRKKLDALPERSALVKRLREVFATDERHVPVNRGDRLFFTGRSKSQEKAVLYVREHDGRDRVLIDPNTWPTKDNPSLHEWVPSNDGTKLTYEVSLHNADATSLHVLDVGSGREQPADAIVDQFAPSVGWVGAKGFYYRFLPPGRGGSLAERGGDVEIRYHLLGTDPAHDAVVHEKTGDAALWLAGSVSWDGHWLLASVSHGDTATELYLRDLRRAQGTRGGDTRGWTTISKGEHARLSAEIYEDHVYVLTNDGSPNSRIVVIDPAHADHDSWRELVPERKDARLETFAVAGGKLVLQYYKDVVTHLEVHGLDGRLEREIPLPAAGTAQELSSQPDDDVARFEFSSYTHPPEIHDVSVRTGTDKIWFRATTPVDLSKLEEEEVFYTSKDGTRVPMFLVHAKGLKRDGSAPAWLEGYGGFDITYGPEFTRYILPWLERGGVWAWADLRGGGEYGEKWHEAGMRHQKQNVFDDFAAAAEYLVHEGFTKPERLVAYSSSNGGLLMGAATTQRPDLFRVIVCGAPLLDMIRFPLVGAGALWKDEYGDPGNEEDFRSLFAYSPLHHVTPGTRYPSFLMMSPADDDRVDPMHARKFLAALQAATTGGPVLLRLDRDAGHFGGGSQQAKIDYQADLQAFVLAELSKTGAVMEGTAITAP